MGFLSQFFVNAHLLGLAALVAVPIIIYLINRHRYRRRKWAAVEFLLRALKRSQRRLQIENLLLLLIRCAILLLLALALARPVLHRGAFIGSQGGQNWIFVLDTSYSMDYRDGPRSLFEGARETTIELVEEMLQKGDRVAVMTMAWEPRVLVGRSPLSPETQRRIAREVRDLEISHRSVRMVPTLRLLDELSAEFASPTGEPEPCNVVFFSDLQRKDWLREGEPVSPEIKDTLQAMRDRGFEFRVARLATTDIDVNVAVTELSLTPEIVSTGVPVEIRVTVHNFGTRDASGIDLSVRVDPPVGDGAIPGEANLGEVIRVPAGSSATRMLPFRFDEPGYHSIVAEVRSDGLVVDNRRYLATRVEDEVEILLVDGDPAIRALERETFYLQVALEPRDDSMGALTGRVTPFLPVNQTADFLSDVPWKRYSVVVLANVAEIPKRELAGLERYVAEGGALIVFLGPNVRPEIYNSTFYRAAAEASPPDGDASAGDGVGLLPLRLKEVRGDDDFPVYLEFVDRAHPVARYFEEHKETTTLQRSLVPFYRYFLVERPDAESPVRVVCQFSDLDKSPAVFDNPFGRGRVMWFTSTADQGWNELPVWRDYVVFLHEAIAYLVGFRHRTDNLRVGEPFERIYESSEFAAEVLLHAPPLSSAGAGDVSSLRTFRRPMREIAKERRFRVTYDDTTVPGLYRLELNRGAARVDAADPGETDPGEADTGDGAAEDAAVATTRSEQYFAVNVDNAESDLAGMTTDDFELAFGVRPVEADFSARLRRLEREKEQLRGVEYWPFCLGAAILLMLLETALAQIFGRRTR